MIILGLGFTDHDASAALVVDGHLKTAIARERLTRLKRDGKMFGSRKLDLMPAIQYCLQEHHLKVADVDLLVWNHIDHIPAKILAFQLITEGGNSLHEIPALVLPHHFAHASASFYLSPFKESAVLVADGLGGPLRGLLRDCAGPEPESIRSGGTIVQNLLQDEPDKAREMESFYFCDGQEWKPLRKIVGSDRGGIGARYGAISALLFGSALDAGKTMGLAPYGQPSERAFFLEARGTEEMQAYAATYGPAWDAPKHKIKAWKGVAGNDYTKLNYESVLPANFAATVQHEAEQAMLDYARWLRKFTGAANLCLSGGVALNCVANSHIARASGFANIFVPPAPGDDGIAVGCALYGAALHGELIRDSCRVFLGRPHVHDPEEFTGLGLAVISPAPDMLDWLAQRLAEGAVLAWYEGGAELGPRALGHRSFLADPRNPEMRDYLNKVVKNRESFRPFAPVVLDDAVLEYFEEAHPSYFMSFVARVREEKRSTLPAVTHVDGTARYQVLRKADNSELYRLIGAFAKHTGIPMLLNTSLNRAGEPIVETPLEAARCMLAGSADYLAVDGIVYARRWPVMMIAVVGKCRSGEAYAWGCTRSEVASGARGRQGARWLDRAGNGNCLVHGCPVP